MPTSENLTALPRPRRGWRETVEPGVYRAHRTRCASTADHKPGRRCGCPWQVAVPGAEPGKTRLLKLDGPTLTEARNERRRLMAAGRAEAPGAAPETGTLADLARDYFRAKAPVLAAHTIATTDTDYRLRIDLELGHLPLADLTRERVEGWLAKLVASGVGHRLVERSIAALRVILATGVEWGRLPTNPAARLRAPSAPTHHEQRAERVLDRSQLAQLLVTVARNPRLSTLVRAAAEAGLRRGELVGLKWSDVDTATRRLTVRRSVSQTASDGKVVKPTKGRRARRVAITASLAADLDRWRTAILARGTDPEGYVWPGRDGGPMDAHSPTQAVERAVRRAGLVDREGRPLVTLHGLRHTAASVMLASGVPLLLVSRQLGHADPQVTATVYAHLLGDAQLDAAAAAFEATGDAQTLREALREDEG